MFGLSTINLWGPVAAGLAVIGFIGFQHGEIVHYKNQVVEWTNKFTAEHLTRVKEHDDAEALSKRTDLEYRAKENAWKLSQKETRDEAERRIDAAHAAASAAERARSLLQSRTQALVAQARRASNNSGITVSCSSAGDAADLLGRMLSRVDEAAGTVGRYADDAHIAGQACERSYDALTAGAAASAPTP